MTILLTLLPFIISFSLGVLLLRKIRGKDKADDIFIDMLLAGGLGMGVSAFLVFFSLLLMRQYSRGMILGLHVFLLLFWGIPRILDLIKDRPRLSFPAANDKRWLFLLILVLFTLPAVALSWFYPLGGWDAWSTWNLKAKFILLGGPDWKDVFAPTLWRSSPHYPLLLPLITVWGWSLVNQPVPFVPAVTALLFYFLLASLLGSTLWKTTQRFAVILAPLLMLSLHHVGMLAASQYSDVVLAYFLLAAFVCLDRALRSGKHADMLLCGLMAGFLSFTKAEGALAAFLITALTLFTFRFQTREESWGPRASSLKFFLFGLLLGSLPSMIFKIAISPANQTFINGLLSEENGISLYRLSVIGIYLLAELKGAKWRGLWILLILGILLAPRKLFDTRRRLIPVFIGNYLLGILAYYFLNTYFEITWWMQVTLDRILLTVLPLMMYWIFSGLLEEQP